MRNLHTNQAIFLFSSQNGDLQKGWCSNGNFCPASGVLNHTGTQVGIVEEPVTSQTASDFRPKFVATIFSSFVSSHPLFFFLPHIAMNHVRGFIINFYNIGDPSTILRLQPRSAIKISGYVPSLVKSGNRFGLTLTQLDHPVHPENLAFFTAHFRSLAYLEGSHCAYESRSLEWWKAPNR